MKPKVYIETMIISYFTSWRSPQLVMAANQESTEAGGTTNGTTSTCIFLKPWFKRHQAAIRLPLNAGLKPSKVCQFCRSRTMAGNWRKS